MSILVSGWTHLVRLARLQTRLASIRAWVAENRSCDGGTVGPQSEKSPRTRDDDAGSSTSYSSSRTFRRELGDQMRIAALLESSRQSNVEDRLWPVALRAGEWKCRWERGRTSLTAHGGLGGAPRVQRSPLCTS